MTICNVCALSHLINGHQIYQNRRIYNKLDGLDTYHELFPQYTLQNCPLNMNVDAVFALISAGAESGAEKYYKKVLRHAAGLDDDDDTDADPDDDDFGDGNPDTLRMTAFFLGDDQ